MAVGKRTTAAAKKTAGIKGKRITGKQKVARRKNIAITRKYKEIHGRKKGLARNLAWGMVRHK